MQFTLASIVALAAVAYAAPQGVTSDITPTATAPAGCSTTYAGQFNIEVVNASTVTKRQVVKVSGDECLGLQLYRDLTCSVARRCSNHYSQGRSTD